MSEAATDRWARVRRRRRNTDARPLEPETSWVVPAEWRTDLVDAIHELVAERNWTIAEAARRSGLNRQAVRRWNDTLSPNMESMLMLCAGLGISPLELMRRAGFE